MVVWSLLQEEERKREAARQEAERQRWADEREREKELELIKQQYLGGEKQKKKMQKPSDKFKFNFDWDSKDDTSKDLNPLYNNLHGGLGKCMADSFSLVLQQLQALPYSICLYVYPGVV